MTQAPDTVFADDGRGLWVTEMGSGAPLILCHGGPGQWDMFGDLAPALAAKVRVIRWDQRGCGRSERRGPYSLARSVADLEAVRRHLAVDQVAVLGHSWGAQLALRYALDHPGRVSDLIYVSGTGLGWGWHEPFKRNLAERLAPHQPRIWHEPELVAACQGLTVPTLIIDGETDIRPRWAVDSLEQALPRVTRVTLLIHRPPRPGRPPGSWPGCTATRGGRGRPSPVRRSATPVRRLRG